MKKIKIYSFKSETYGGCPAKTRVYKSEHPNGKSGYIIEQFSFMKSPTENQKIIRKWRECYYVKQVMGFKPESFDLITHIIYNAIEGYNKLNLGYENNPR